MTRLVLLTPVQSSDGFALAGVEQVTVASEEVLPTLRHLMTDPGIGVVAIDERLLADLPEARLRALERNWSGLLLVLPPPEAGTAAPDYLQRLMQRVLGYQVRLQR